jgi:diguanylate cyclase (GGDEF)-like protein/PAS domain S-box-containing protein
LPGILTLPGTIVALTAVRDVTALVAVVAAFVFLVGLAVVAVILAWPGRGRAESNGRYRTLFDTSFDAVYLHSLDGRFIDANEATLQLLGYSRGELMELSIFDFVDDSQHRAVQTAIGEIINGHKQVEPRTVKAKRKDGTLVHVQAVSSLIENESGCPCVLGIAHDISERVRAEEVLRGSEEKYRQIYESVQDIYYRTDATGIIIEISPAVERWGYTREEMIGTQVLDVYADPEERSDLLNELVTKGEVSDHEVVLIAADGHLVNSSVGSHVVRDAEGKVIGVEGTLRDITERKQAEQALREQMRRDPLTGVLNHAAIVSELRDLIATGSDGAPVAVMMSDVDSLKAINDTFGHPVGDCVLVSVAESLSANGARVGRYGGDEFVAILHGAGRAEAERYEKKVVDSLDLIGMRDPQTGARVPVHVSIGTAIYPIEAGRIEELIELADSAMYAAKRRQREASMGLLASTDRRDGAAARIVGEIVPFLTTPGDLDEKLRLVAHRLSVTAGYDAVSFALFAKESGTVPSVSTFARLPERVLERWNAEQTRRRTSDTSIRQLVHQGRPVIMDDPRRNKRLTESERSMLRKAGLKSALVAPMLWRNELIGTLSVASKRENALTPRDAQLLSAIATQVTAIVSLETLVEKLRLATGRLSLAHTETVMLLAAAAEAHDRTTGEHLKNVRAISEQLARELGYGEEEAQEIGLAAVLHDMGKIRVPDSVLGNTGRLAEAEWELMKHHSVWGEQFLAGRTGFELASAIARCHHERWDGGGYPDGLGGEEISEPATIVSVADSFDAMTSDRPYRPGRSVAAAIQELVTCSGSQFSPRVVDAMVRLQKRRKLPRPRRLPAEEQAA